MVVASLLILGCVACVPLSKPSLQELHCDPPPAPQCLPGVFSDAPFDTSSSKFLPGPTFLRIEPVVGFDRSDRNEYGAVFRDSLFGWLTVDIGTVLSFSLQETADVHAEVGVVCEDGAFGAVAVAGNKPVVAGFVANTERQGQADLVAFQLKHGVASELQHLENVNSATAWDSHPTLSADGQILVFASDRLGGYGGTDLWYSFRTSDGFSEPVNMGPGINTACHEITPSLSADGVLLFSSNGHNTIGGYDIFRAKIEIAPQTQTVVFAAPTNVGAPLNTERDELFPSCSGTTMLPLYYSSDQAQPGDFDVYVMYDAPRPGIELGRTDREIDISTELYADPVEVLTLETSRPAEELPEQDTVDSDSEQIVQIEPEKPIVTVDSVKIRGIVKNEENKPVATAKVEVATLPDRNIVAETTTNESGEYEVQSPRVDSVEVSVSHPELFPSTVVLTPSEKAIVSVPEIVLERSLQLRIHFPTDDHSQPYEMVLDSNGVSSQSSWDDELDKVAKDLLAYQDDIERIVLVGHTDDAASVAYNFQLGQRRVEFVVQQLVARGVPARMLEARSAGETQLLPRREGETMQQWRLRCRRVELARVVR